jgi:DNA polymerase theta
MVAVFCEKLGWKNLELLVSQFQTRLHFGVTRDLCDLMQVPSMDSRMARALFDAGVETCADLAGVHPAVVEQKLVTTGPFSKLATFTLYILKTKILK